MGEDLEFLLQLFAGITTAAATLALVFFTRTLARETRRLSDATSQPFVVATLEPNPWSMRHIDLRIENSGNAPAFDVRVTISPPVAQAERSSKGGLGMDSIDVLRPGQSIVSFVAEANSALKTTYLIESRWRKHPRSSTDETLSYDIDMKKWKKLSRLGPLSPSHQIAAEIKGLRNDWRSIALGQRHLKVDVRTERDRERERDEIQHRYGDSILSPPERSGDDDTNLDSEPPQGI